MIRNLVALFGITAVLGSFSALGCTAAGVGDPCTPESEYRTDFSGFDRKEVNVEAKSFQCQTRVCLVNHFQGRTTCPYGKQQARDENGKLLVGGDGEPVWGPCLVPGTSEGPSAGGAPLTVKPACANRQADKAVYCSCRCANVQGRTDDGANYCKCGDGYSCTQLVGAVGAQQLGLTGAYCIKNGTAFTDDGACPECDPKKRDCGSDNGK